jgi:transglutaminase-like putative cysteine protease
MDLDTVGSPSGDEDERLRLVVGCEFELRVPMATTAVLQVAPHGQQDATINGEWWETSDEHHGYDDTYVNRCERFALQPGESRIGYRAEVTVRAAPDEVAVDAAETSTGDLPDGLLHWVMPSRFCQPDELGNDAWEIFGSVEPGWGRVQAVCDFVNSHIEYLAGSSNPWTTAMDAYRARQGVCRDFAHLAISFCRALNIPARYVFGYIPDIGVPLPEEPMDFSAWFEVYLSDRWYTFDARLNQPRVGRVVVGRGLDAVDVAMMTSLGAVDLVGFHVQADQRA